MANYTNDAPKMGSTASGNGSVTTPAEAGNNTLVSNYTTVASTGTLPLETGSTLQGNTSVTLSSETGFRTTLEPYTGSTSERSFTQTSGESVTSTMTTSNNMIDGSDYNMLSE